MYKKIISSLSLDQKLGSIKGEYRAVIREALQAFPGLDMEVTIPVLQTMEKWIHHEVNYANVAEAIQSAIDEHESQESINQLAKLHTSTLSRLQGELLNLIDDLSFEDSRIFKKVLDVYLVLTNTDPVIRNHEIPRQYIERGPDGQWHLKPGEMHLKITREMLEPQKVTVNGETKTNENGFNIREVIAFKSGSYAVSTAGYRSRQNILFPWDGNSNFGFFEEAITAYSQSVALALSVERQDQELQNNVRQLRGLVSQIREERGIDAKVKDGVILADLLQEQNKEASNSFKLICDKMKKIAGKEVRFNSNLYQELFVRIAAAMGVEVHTPPVEGQNLMSIWLASFLIFSQDYDGGNYITSSHARDNYQCSKDLSGEGAQYTPDVSLNFAAINDWVVKQVEENGEFVITIAAADHPKIVRDLDGTDEYIDLLRTSVLTPDNLALIKKAEGQGFKVKQDCVGGCMGPLMKTLYEKTGTAGVVEQINTEYDPFQRGIGKAVVRSKSILVDEEFRKRATLPNLEFNDEGLDASKKVVVNRMDYKTHLAKDPVGTVITNTDPDGDRFVIGQVMANTAENREKLSKYGVNYIELDGNLYCYYSPNKAFLMTTAFYLDQLRESGKIQKGDTAVIMKTAQTSYAFNEFAKAYEKKWGIKVVVVEPTVGFKEIAASERDIEGEMRKRSDTQSGVSEIEITDALNNKHNLGSGRIILVSASEESGGQELAPPDGITSRGGRFALGNREKSAGVASFLALVMGADFYLKDMTILDYWEKLINDYGLTYIQDERADERLFNDGILDPSEFKRAQAEGNQKKILNNRYWWNLARHYEEGKLTLSAVKGILKSDFPNIEQGQIDRLQSIQSVITAGMGTDRAKDGVYLMFDGFYIAIRPSGTDPVIKGYYSGNFDPAKGKEIGAKVAGFCPEHIPRWQSKNYYESDPYK